jgi:alkanesulfonate monooxygenase SsuD/methylene tetrahydromethanopterin reductase-like flavin-dependent oxidoreductase (luciferase family)
VSRLSTLVLTGSADETAATKEFIRQVGADPSGSDVGTADELVARVEELGAAGVEYFVFNLPTGTPDTVREVGKILVDRFAG